MSITRELENLKKLESVGFSHEQAETLADVIEKSHVESREGRSRQGWTDKARYLPYFPAFICDSSVGRRL